MAKKKMKESGQPRRRFHETTDGPGAEQHDRRDLRSLTHATTPWRYIYINVETTGRGTIPTLSASGSPPCCLYSVLY